MSGEATNPGVLIVSGGDDYRRRRFVRTFTARKASEGWVVYPLLGTDSESLGAILSSTGVLFSAPALCVVTNPEKLPLELLKARVAEGGDTVVLLLEFEGEKPPAAIAALVPKTATKTFALPAFYKMEEYATEFVREEFKGLKVSIDPGLALALVRKVGTDLGMLSFEVSKAATLCHAQGVTAVTPEIIKDSMAPLSELDGSGLIEALGSGNLKRIAVEFSRYRTSKGGDPTIELCGRVLTPTVLRWFQAAHMDASGVSSTAAAGRMGANPWFWENKVLPTARSLGADRCRKMLSVIAAAQTAVFTGAVFPWGVLEAGMFQIFKP